MPSTALQIASKKFTDEEQQLIAAMSKPGAQVEVVFPAEIDAKQWKSSTSLACRVLVRAQLQEQAMMPVLGRLLVIAKTTPAITEGHESFESFMAAEVYGKYGVGRSTCFEAMQMCRWPGLTIAQFEAIGRRNFKLLNQAVPKGDENEKWAKNLLAKAAEMTEPELEEYCEEKNYLEKGEAQGAHVKFGCSKAALKRITKWFKDPEIVAAAGTENPADIFEAMMAECESEWRHRGAAIIKENVVADPEPEEAEAEEAEVEAEE